MSENPAEPLVHFLLIGDLAEISFNPALPEGLQFADPSSGVKILVTAGSDAFRPLTCKAYMSLPTSARAYKFIASLLEQKFEAYAGMPITLPHSRGEQTLIDANGVIAEGFGVPFEFYPPEVQSLCDTAREQLLKTSERLVRLIRWQQNLDGPHWLFTHNPPLYWKIGGDDYWIVRFRRQQITANSPAGIEWKEADQADLAIVWNDVSAEEGLAHELLREAKVLEGSSPRSAFLIATTALEVGVKAYVAHVSPDTTWLLAELPSPPIHKILRAYIPELQKRQGRPLGYWEKLKPLFNRVAEHAVTRNRLVHAGTIEIKPEVLSEYLRDISDLLYLFDILRGHEWAKHNLSHSLLTVLGWPPSRRTRFIVRTVIDT